MLSSRFKFLTMSVIKLLRKLLKFGFYLILFFIGYFVLMLMVSCIPYNKDFKSSDTNAVEIYILSNGVHTDLVMPLKNELKDWTEIVEPNKTKSQDSTFQYVSFGWGDKGFYLETPTWADLKTSTALKAMFFINTTAMHVSFYKNLKESEHCKKICISKQHYDLLVQYISKSFKLNNAKTLLIEGASYGDNDIFYDAKGTYSMFYTCNSWANEGLKDAGLKSSLWTLFDWGIFFHYR